MASAHVGFEQQHIVVGLHIAQLGDHLCRLPIGHARVIQSSGPQHGRVSLCRDIVIGAIAADIFERGLVGDWVAPFGPFARRQRQILVEHGVEHIDKGHMADDRAK